MGRLFLKSFSILFKLLKIVGGPKNKNLKVADLASGVRNSIFVLSLYI